MMKSLLLIFYCLLLATPPLFAQDAELAEPEPKAALTVGVLQGGGSLIGADIEFLLGNRIGIQGGAGFIGFGAGLNYHLKPSIRSSFISLQYWHQGSGETFTQSLLGPGFVYRAKKLFTASLGLGFALEEGPSWPDDKDQPPVMLTYSIGIWFPMK